jgi:cytochrome oxidase assembly protein ShyY1
MRIKPIPAIICLCLAALGVVLGMWQLSRAEGKRALQQAWATRAALAPLDGLQLAQVADSSAALALDGRRVLVRGEFLPQWVVYLDNRQQQGQPGLWVMMPFKLAQNGATVLVARGWLPRDKRDRSAIAPYATPAGPVELQALVRSHVARLMQLGADVSLKSGAIVQNLDLQQARQASNLPLLPLLLEQTVPAHEQDHLGRIWPQASSGIEKHEGYAFQWFALAAVAMIFFVLTGWRRGTS